MWCENVEELVWGKVDSNLVDSIKTKITCHTSYSLRHWSCWEIDVVFALTSFASDAMMQIIGSCYLKGHIFITKVVSQPNLSTISLCYTYHAAFGIETRHYWCFTFRNNHRIDACANSQTMLETSPILKWIFELSKPKISHPGISLNKSVPLFCLKSVPRNTSCKRFYRFKYHNLTKAYSWLYLSLVCETRAFMCPI